MAIHREGERSRGISRDVFSESAFETFYRRSFTVAWGIARRAAASDEDAEDVCQKAYLAVFRYWSEGTLREPPEHLLYRVVKRGAIDLLRARGRRIRLFGALPPETQGADAVGGPLGRALRLLRPQDAALILLQAAGGLTYEELARVERASVAAVRSRLFRARRELARRYEDEGGEW
jgi:RNA polymerase sigma-70 factor (ECF subfamily)